MTKPLKRRLLPFLIQKYKQNKEIYSLTAESQAYN